MLALVIRVLDCLLSGMTVIFRLFLLVGRLIAHLACWLGRFLVLFHEEFANLGDEVYESARTLGVLVQNISADVLDMFTSILEIVIELLTTGHISSGRLPTVCTHTASKLRHFVIDLSCLLGNSVWMLVTVIPNLIWFLGRFACLLVCSAISVITDFFVELPLSAVVGLAILSVFISLHKTTLPIAHRVCKMALRVTLLPIQRRLNRELNRILREAKLGIERNMAKVRAICVNGLPRKMSTRIRSPPPQPSTPNKDRAVGSSSSCVICQELEKSVVLFPCRHLCLCQECWAELRRYDNNCPLCRHPISRAVTVFA